MAGTSLVHRLRWCSLSFTGSRSFRAGDQWFRDDVGASIGADDRTAVKRRKRGGSGPVAAPAAMLARHRSRGDVRTAMRTVVITGAAGAIGRALIEVLAEGPYRLGLIDVPGAPLDEAAALARVETIVHESLLDSDVACAQAAAACGATIHGLAHLAGVYQPDPDLARTTGVWERAIEHNLANAYRM